MKVPTPASFAPGLPVGGKMVSATSPRKSTVSGSKRPSTLLVAFLVHPSKNRLAPTTVPPIIQATRANASLLFIADYLLKLTFAEQPDITGYPFSVPMSQNQPHGRSTPYR